MVPYLAETVMYFNRVFGFVVIVGLACFTITMAKSWGILGHIIVLLFQITMSWFGSENQALGLFVVVGVPTYAAIRILDWVFAKRPEVEKRYITPIDYL